MLKTKTTPLSALFNVFKYFMLIGAAVISLLPVCVCVLTAFKTTDEYNEYYMSNLYLQSPELKTISTALYRFTGPYGNQYNYICAGVIITIIPILILFLIFQKQVYSGMAAGAVKG